MVYKTDYFETCGASKIGEYFALTAGHCWSSRNDHGVRVNQNKDDFLIVSNTDDLDNIRNSTEIEATSSLDRYNVDNRQDDFVIVKTKHRLAGTAISLATPQGDRIVFGDEGFVSGFGNTANDGHGHVTQSRKLLYYEGGIQPNTSCESYREFVPSKMFCFGPGRGQRKGDCAGDSGGPVVIRRNGNVFQIGVVSFGARPCGAPNRPSVEARISSSLEFIKSSVRALNGGRSRAASSNDPRDLKHRDSVFLDE
jgi:secreted trypsin-like serine protease